MTLSVTFTISGLIALSAYKACAPTRCKLVEEIFLLFGWKNVARINLKKITKDKEKSQKIKGEWYDPSEQNKLPRPSRKFGCLLEHWFYY
ncbi:hypothetical protein [Buttiauxella brennerae]|uniref:hypothetical protein n=1 Tax=Buttiauxella brennerae TaxID=82988 RepID=UPI00286F303B|nr:hypothetical protein [Buttiauxella brennerae]